MDSLPAHKPAAMRRTIERTDAELRFLQPQLQSHREAFSRVKTFPKKTAARTIDHLRNAVAEAVDLFTSTKCENGFKTAGFECQ